MEYLKYNYSCNVIPDYKTSSLAKKETNDCFVKALAAATGSLYDHAHGFTKMTFKRSFRGGTSLYNVKEVMKRIENTIQQIGDKKITFQVIHPALLLNYYTNKGEKVARKKTIKSFVETYPKGSYIVAVAGHALTVKDGVLIDNPGFEMLTRRRVKYAYRVNLVE